ncbi:MAG: type III-B CRISPR module-associated protein Cmr5 [Geminicoccaceae bacterium]
MAKKKGKPRAFTRAPGAAPTAPPAPPSPAKPSPAQLSLRAASAPSRPIVLRDQQRARFAYARVAAVPKEKRKDYENAVLGLGADILRVGLLAALAAVQRLGDRGKDLLDDLAKAKIPGLEVENGTELVAKARELPVDGYMIATRETLAVVSWLRRACQATFGEEA